MSCDYYIQTIYISYNVYVKDEMIILNLLIMCCVSKLVHGNK